MKIGIVITVKNCLRFTINCIASIRTKYPYTLIVVDDFSTDGTKTWLQALVDGTPDGHVVVISDPDSPSLAGKWNLGVRTAQETGCEAALICNNDILFAPITIDILVERMMQAKQQKENLAIVTASNQRGRASPGIVLGMGNNVENPSESDGPDFSCFLLDIAKYNVIGPFDENFVPCYFEDNDYHIRVAKAGYKAITTSGAPYYHFGSITQNSIPGGLCLGSKFEANRAYFESKHGVSTTSKEYAEITRGVLTTKEE